MEVVSSIITNYRNKEKEALMIKGDDVLSVNLRKQLEVELEELRRETIKSLEDRKKELLRSIGSLMPEILELTTLLSSEDTFLGAKAYAERLIPKQREADASLKELEEIDKFLETNGKQQVKEEVAEIDPDLKLTDESDNLEKASAELEQQASDIIPFIDKSIPKNANEAAALQLYKNIKRKIGPTDAIKLNDSKTRYIIVEEKPIKASIDKVQLPNGEYLSREAVIDALNKYINTEKGRNFVVVGIGKYIIGPEEIQKLRDALSNATQIHVNTTHQAMAITDGKIDNIGDFPPESPVKTYVYEGDILYGLGQLLEEGKDKQYTQKLQPRN